MKVDVQDAASREYPGQVEVDHVQNVQEALVNVRNSHIHYGRELGRGTTKQKGYEKEASPGEIDSDDDGGMASAAWPGQAILRNLGGEGKASTIQNVMSLSQESKGRQRVLWLLFLLPHFSSNCELQNDFPCSQVNT